MQAVADANPTLDAGVYVGQVVGDVKDNFFAIGSPIGQGELVTNYVSNWQGLYSVQPLRRTEDYGIGCTIRTWAGDIDPATRYQDAFTLLVGLMTQLANDKAASGSFGTSGSWGIADVANPAAGELNRKGWGVVLTFTVAVQHVILTNTQ